MAVTLTDAPTAIREGETIEFLSANNPLIFEFTADAGEASLLVQVQSEAGGAFVLGQFPTLPFDPQGLLKVDVAFVLRNYLSNNIDFDNDRSTTVFTGEGSYQRFQILFEWDGGNDTTGVYIATNSVRQIGSEFGATLAEYLPLMTGTTVDFTGKFLTLFENPVLWWYSSVAEPASTADVSVFNTQSAILRREADTANINIFRALWIGDIVDTDFATVVNNELIATFPPPNIEKAYLFKTVQLTAGTDNGAGNLAASAYEPLTFEIRRACINPFAVRWVNSFGIWETWVFEGDTPNDINTSDGELYGIYEPNLSIANESSRNLSKTARNTVSLSVDNLTLDQALALSELYYSPNVRYYAGELADGIEFEDWKGATIDNGSFTGINKNNTKHRLDFTLQLIEINTISN